MPVGRIAGGRILKIGVFGLGLAGGAVAELAGRLGWEVAGYSRSRSLGAGRGWDASRAEDSRRLIDEGCRFEAAVATFPPQDAWPGFWPYLAGAAPVAVLLGTTGIYLREGRRPAITESSPIQPDHPRTPAEESFLASGGIVLRLAGIYGGPRNPLRWIREGRVGYEDRQVNLIHFRDIALAVAEVFRRKPVPRLFNLADGQRHTWRQIIDTLVERGQIRHDRAPVPLKRPDSFVENRLFLSEYPDFEFRDIWSELAKFD